MLVFSSANIELHNIEQQDLECLRQWRNHPEISSQMRSQDPISELQQRQWFASLAFKDEQHFIAHYRGDAIAYVNLKPVSDGVFETGLYVGAERYRGSLVSFLVAICQIDYAFEQLCAQELCAEVKVINHAALRYNQQLGYKEYGENGGYKMLRLQPECFQSARQHLAKFIR